MLRVGFIKNISRGFTLIEVLVVIAIISILAGVIAVNSAESNQKARDEKRQADLRALQSAIEMYKNKYGRYPAGCNSVGSWSGQPGSGYDCGSGTEYIVGLAPEFIPVLPKDPKLNSSVANSGYMYMVNDNDNGTVYKLMAMNTVESEIVTYSHPLKSCDVIPTSSGGFPATGSNGIYTGGFCSYTSAISSSDPLYNTEPVWCKMSAHGGDGRFDISYAVWGGFVAKTGGSNEAARVKNTTTIICR